MAESQNIMTNTNILAGTIIAVALMIVTGIVILSSISTNQLSATTTESDNAVYLSNSDYNLSKSLDNYTLNSANSKVYNMSWLDFDGVNDYVQAYQSNNFFNNTDNQSVSIWFKMNDVCSDATQYCYIFSSPATGVPGNRVYLTLGNDTDLTYCVGTNDHSIRVGFNASEVGNWHNVVIIRYGSINKSRAYLDGVEKAYNDEAIAASLTAPVVLGAIGEGGKYYNGSIDEVRIYNKSLSSSEVTAIYNSGRYENSSLSSNGLLYYPMNEAQGNRTYDLIDNHYGY